MCIRTHSCVHGSVYTSCMSIPTFHNIMCALADSAQTKAPTVDKDDDVLSQEVYGELVRFVISEEYT